MSVASSRLSSVSSLLKSPGMRAKVVNQASKVRFKLPKNLKDILTNFGSGFDHKQYENLIVTIRDADMKDHELLELLTETCSCIPLLGPTHKLFVEALLTPNWTFRSVQVTDAYKGFLIDLISAHNYHTKLVIDKLVNQFKPEDNDSATEWEFSKSRNKDLERLRHVHDVLQMLIRIIPMATDILLQSLVENYPYFRRTTQSHEIYIYALLQILDYAPHLRSDILSLIINRLIVLDVNVPRTEIDEYEDEEDMDETDKGNIGVFTMDEVSPNVAKHKKETEMRRMKHPVAHTLDVCMEQILQYVYHCCHVQGTLDWDTSKNLFKLTISEAFVNWLWRKVSNPNVAPIIRQSSVSYVASLLARATFVDLGLLKATLFEMSSWIHSYISSQDSLECANSDVRVHAVFYSVCQAMFYVIAFRHKHLVNTRKNLLFLQSLNLTKVIACKLNPLKVCQSAVVQNFAAVTRTYQLAYCYSIIEHNARSNLPIIQSSNRVSLWLDTFFPFDPYMLLKSAPRINPIYMMYQGGTVDEESCQMDSRNEIEGDDFMDETLPSLSSSHNDMDVFSYGTSPGFMHP
ncbi:RNA polymerase I-specific transcription initiation factor RRN3 isoform X2 [Athalia rosae]|uniref:RNA polymerase I-specific transcription initiation factor RRN3 isoform X2 n=1 Tax=Athalia rosae TaxID=37344 RepID=UPI0006255AEA|nr:RNA polymerase I-specific transcription initiation factor RRN3 isoform X2 [Athalia rosae]